MPWNYLQAELDASDLLIRPMIGPGGLTRDRAHGEVQSILDRAAVVAPAMRDLAESWRSGVKDDTVGNGFLTWAIYEHLEPDPRAAAVAWLQGFASTMRKAGMAVDVASIRQE